MNINAKTENVRIRFMMAYYKSNETQFPDIQDLMTEAQKKECREYRAKLRALIKAGCTDETKMPVAPSFDVFK